MTGQRWPCRGSRSYCYNNNSPDNTNLKILYYNTRSILYKLMNCVLTACSLYCPDIVCITEMWLNADVWDSEVNIPSYQLVRLDRERHCLLYCQSSLLLSCLSFWQSLLDYPAVMLRWLYYTDHHHPQFHIILTTCQLPWKTYAFKISAHW